MCLAGVAQWVGYCLQADGSPVRFLVRAHTCVAFQYPVGGTYKGQPIDGSLTYHCFPPSLSPSLPLSLKKKKRKRKNGA